MSGSSGGYNNGNGNSLAIRMLWTLLSATLIIVVTLLGAWGMSVERRIDEIHRQQVDAIVRIRELEISRLYDTPTTTPIPDSQYYLK